MLFHRNNNNKMTVLDTNIRVVGIVYDDAQLGHCVSVYTAFSFSQHVIAFTCKLYSKRYYMK